VAEVVNDTGRLIHSHESWVWTACFTFAAMTGRRYFLELSYCGKHYHGWQEQENAPTVQSVLNGALSVFFRQEVATVGCGRTDTGVHARKYYAHADFPVVVEDIAGFCRHLNGILPADIAVRHLHGVAPSAHARFDATSRTYEYLVYASKNPFLREWACFHPQPLDTGHMNALASRLLVQTDFSSFCKGHSQARTHTCRVMRAGWSRKEEGVLVFTITADRFLRNMVRAIVGTLVVAGEGKMSEDEFTAVLEGKDRRLAGASMPAHGLYLTDITYPYIG
jgi:tRNA pseudouridine38-40 synthase